MKIESTSFSDFSIFINRDYLDIDDYKDQDQVVKYVKILVKKLRNKLNLKGFYKLKVFVNNIIGLFVDVIKIDDLEYSNILDLRVIVFLDSDIYFETDDYFLISDNKKIIFYDDKFYCSVVDLDNIYNYLEFGNFIYGDEVLKILEQGTIV